MKQEIRKIESDFTADEERKIEGYAVVFESSSVDMGFTEIIHAGAITEDTIKNSDVIAKFNHSDDKVLARSKFGEGTLQLEVDDHGLKYSFDAPHTATGDEVLELIRRGDLTSSSFAFTLNYDDPNAEKWENTNNSMIRHIYKIDRLFDISPVFCPAYESTECDVTSKRFADVQLKSEEVNKAMDSINNEIQNM